MSTVLTVLQIAEVIIKLMEKLRSVGALDGELEAQARAAQAELLRPPSAAETAAYINVANQIQNQMVKKLSGQKPGKN